MSDERRIATKEDIFSLDRLIGWLAMKPKSYSYCYELSGHCLLANYARENGFERAGFCYDFWTPDGNWSNSKDFPKGFDEISRGHPHTYGAALERARNLNR